MAVDLNHTQHEQRLPPSPGVSREQQGQQEATKGGEGPSGRRTVLHGGHFVLILVLGNIGMCGCLFE